MTIEKWAPFPELVGLRDAMNSLFQDGFVPSNGARPGRGATTLTLPLDITEAEDEFVVMASMPGIKPEDVQATVLGDTLTIRGESSVDEGRAGHLARRSPCRLIPAFGQPGHADRCGQRQCSVRARRADPDFAEVGASPSQAGQSQRSVDSSRPGCTSRASPDPGRIVSKIPFDLEHASRHSCHCGSTTTSVLTELARKQAWWARWWS